MWLERRQCYPGRHTGYEWRRGGEALFFHIHLGREKSLCLQGLQRVLNVSDEVAESCQRCALAISPDLNDVAGGLIHILLVIGMIALIILSFAANQQRKVCILSPSVGGVITLRQTMSSTIYLVGHAVIIVGLALGAHFLRIPTRWIVVGVLVLVGMGLTGLAKSRQGRQ